MPKLQDIIGELNKISSELRIARTELDNPFEDHHAKWYDWAYKDSLKKPEYVDGYLLERSVSTSNRMKDLARALGTLAAKVEDPDEEEVDKAMRALPFLRSKIENVLRGMAVLDGAASAVSHVRHLEEEKARDEEFGQHGPHKDHHYWSSERQARTSLEREVEKMVGQLEDILKFIDANEKDLMAYPWAFEMIDVQRSLKTALERAKAFHEGQVMWDEDEERRR